MKAALAFAAMATLVFPGEVAAQAMDHHSMDHSGHAQADEPAPAPQGVDPHAGHGGAHVPEAAPDMQDMDHSGHDMSAMPAGSTAPPAIPNDHAADALFDPAEMARARSALRKENGAFTGSMVLVDIAEFQARKGRNGYRWGGEAWFGGDINRLLIKSEGAGTFGEPVEDAEIQALYSRAITPFWNAHVGVRHDFAPNPSRTHAVVGAEGIAPYWIHLTAQAFLSDRGELQGRIESSYDERITQRLILQPRTELNLAAQDIMEIGIGSGLTDFDLGLRLRYEIRREFAPYVGVSWKKKTGKTARMARMAGEDADSVNLAAGIRFWF